MGTIQIKDLTFQYKNQITPIFKQVDLSIDESWHLGLIGRNGRGKTTLLKILQQQVAFSGDLTTNLNFQYFPQPIAQKQHLTYDILLELTHKEPETFWQINRELKALQLDETIIWQPFDTLSPGQQTKVQLAALFTNTQTFQLIDEPTNHLDQVSRQIVADYLESKKGFIVVSHDRDFLNQIIDHVIAINRQNITIYQGNYDTWQQQMQLQTQNEIQQNQTLKKEIAHLKKASRQKSEWAKQAERGKQAKSVKTESANIDRGFVGHRAAKVMKRATVYAKRLDETRQNKQNLFKNIEINEPLNFNYQSPRQAPLLKVKDLVLTQQQVRLNQPVSFEIQAGQQLAITGNNGVGKSTLMKSLLGQQQFISSGQVDWYQNVQKVYLPQNLPIFSGQLTDYAQSKGLSPELLLTTLRKLGFERDLFYQDMQQFSLGQKRKVGLALCLCQPGAIYFLDEPLNYLDIISRQQIQDAIAVAQPTLLFIEHDQHFIKSVASDIIHLEKA